MSTKQILRTYFFASSSSSKQYQTLEYVDGSCSCECFGWVRRVLPDGSRSCKHTRSVEAGQGPIFASQVVEYSGKPAPKELKPVFAPRTRPDNKPKPERVFTFDE